MMGDIAILELLDWLRSRSAMATPGRQIPAATSVYVVPLAFLSVEAREARAILLFDFRRLGDDGAEKWRPFRALPAASPIHNSNCNKRDLEKRLLETDGIIAAGVNQWNRQNPNFRAKS
jgi:hypothetical protein